MKAGPEVVLVRHGETEWSLNGQHTSRTDVPLTDGGRQQAELLGRRLAARRFMRVLASPRDRALETCRLAGFGDEVELRHDLEEWDYGDYEGMTTAEIRHERPEWSLWRDGCPGGEDAAGVAGRVDPVIAELRGLEGDAVLFAHGHLLRVLAARWLELDPAEGRLLGLSTAAMCALGHEHENRVVWLWNESVA